MTLPRRSPYQVQPTGLVCRPSKQGEGAVVVFHQRGATLHPIAVVDVPDGADQALLDSMGMAANHPVGFVLTGALEHRSLIHLGSAEILDRACKRTFEV